MTSTEVSEYRVVTRNQVFADYTVFMTYASIIQVAGLHPFCTYVLSLQKCTCKELEAADQLGDFEESSPKKRRSVRRQLQAELRESARVELEHVRALKKESGRNTISSTQRHGDQQAAYAPGSGALGKQPCPHETCRSEMQSSGSSERKKTASPDVDEQAVGREESSQEPQVGKRLIFRPKLHPLLAALRSSTDSDSSSDTSSSDEDNRRSPRIAVGRPHTVQRRSCLKGKRPRGGASKANPRVDWSPVVDAATFFEYVPTIFCIIPEENVALDLRSPANG